MKRYLPFLIVAAVALVTVGSGTMLYRTKHAQLLPVSENRSLSGKTGTESMHIRGNPDAPVTLEEFADFQCPPCGNFAGFGEELLKQYDSRLRIVFRNFPLPGHEHAREAALAAEAAGLQGRFWEMHDVLYREQAVWSKTPNPRELFESYAGTIGLNLDQFKKDMDGEKARERVDSDHALGDSLGITLTPTLFINNHPVDPKEESYAIIGACFKVYNEKGCGFLGPVYQECLGIEFEYQRIPAITKPSLALSYRGRILRQTYEADYVCFGKIIVELKAVSALTD